ncbi:hypothetical protein PCL_01376 [Purpureocillium lilacinum]|uniref:Uncharacterized protein n=1 Tax=Purpureocillium lilacinum TaxID=33203 RepID=A0A2U3E3A0_PURLI|nr:hypothetical protein PCL_01376 [Purpureocillium lilacinum]
MRYGADGGGIGRGTSVNGPKGGGREVDGAADGMRWIGCQRGVAGGSWKTKSTGGRDDMDGRTGACSAWNGLTGSITVAGDSPGLRAGQQLLKRWAVRLEAMKTFIARAPVTLASASNTGLATCMPKQARRVPGRVARVAVLSLHRTSRTVASATAPGKPGLRAPTTVMGVPDSALRQYLPAAPTNRPGHRLARGSVSPSFAAAAADSKDDDHDDCAPPSPPPAPLNRLHIDTQRRESRHGSSSHATTLRAHSTPELSRRRQSTP